MTKIHICSICGGEFPNRWGHPKTCSPVCRKELKNRRKAAFIEKRGGAEYHRIAKAKYRAKNPEAAKAAGVLAHARRKARLEYYENLVADMAAALTGKEDVQ